MMTGFKSWIAKQFTETGLARWSLRLLLLHLLISAVLTFSSWGQDIVLIQDSLEYLQLASFPLTDGIYSLDGIQSSGKREPGYSGLIMAFMAAGLVKPHTLSAIQLWPIIATQIILYGWVCRRIVKILIPVFGLGSSWLALGIMQASPICIYQYSLASECLTTILLGLLFLEIESHWKMGPSWPAVLRSALWLGLLGITKSVNVLFMPVLSLLLWVRLPVKLPKVAVFLLLSLLPALAWTARNKAVFGLPIMGSIDGFSSLYRANILPYYQISSPDHPAMPEVAQKAIAACKNDAEKYLWYKKAALDWLKANPVQYVKQCIHRTAAMFIDLYREATIPWWQYPIYLLIGNDQLFLTVALLFCLAPLWRKHEIWAEVACLYFLFSVGIYGAVYGQERYLHPTFFLLAPVHAWCFLAVIWPWVKLQWHRIKQ